jgi:hypothetical protein
VGQRDEETGKHAHGDVLCRVGPRHVIWQIDVEEGFSLEALLEELGTLEEKGIGRKIHGR